MNNEYEFFKQFAGVTEEDLRAYKCGGKTKKVEKDCGGGCATKIRKHEDGGLQKKKYNYDIEQKPSSTRVAPPENLRNNKMSEESKKAIEQNRRKTAVKNITNKTIKKINQEYNYPIPKKA